MIIEYGDGLIHTQQGVIEGRKCLTIKKLEKPLPINSTPKEWKMEYSPDECLAVLVFKNIEGARTLQDELNELISIWSKEQSPVV